MCPGIELFSIEISNSKFTEEVYELMKQCWQEDPKKRPSFGRIHEILDALEQKYSAAALGRRNNNTHSTMEEPGESSFYKLDVI
jgi:hypothetical protein